MTTEWHKWQIAEYTQLDQYETQETFGLPCRMPPNANVLNLLWTYVYKEAEKRFKSCCVCNGSPTRKGTVMLAETYASSLEQTGSRIFWAITAIHNYIVVGTDASDAFAEAPHPKAPLYVYLDKPFREWWQHKGYSALHPSHNVMRVKKALQGHPESPRLWANLIDNITNDLGFLPCHHGPCLYYNPNYNGHKLFFIRQVDDFAISAPTTTIANSIIASINSKMTVQIKSIRLVNRFNGVDISQTSSYVKISNKTYIEMILRDKNWLHASIPGQYSPAYIPMHSDPEFNKTIEEADPISEKELKCVEKGAGFSYKQGKWELIYALVTCCPDIYFSLIKLAQYSTKPALLRFQVLQGIYQYLKDTKIEGIHYWRTALRTDCPILPLHTQRTDYNNYTPHSSRLTTIPTIFNIQVDASYAGDTTHRCSVTGIVAHLAGGCILYKKNSRCSRP